MPKILIALDQNRNFVRDLAGVSEDLLRNDGRNLLIAFVVKDMAYTSTLSTYFKEPAMIDYPSAENLFLSEEDKLKAEVISNFEKDARDAGLRYDIHNDFNVSASDLIRHTTYADLLILSYQVFFNPFTHKPDTSLLYLLLKGSRCPVLIIPEGMQPVKNIIFTYDGKESSVFAIRAFSGLFSSSARDKEVTILNVTPGVEEEIKNEACLMKLVQQHFNNVGLQLLTGSNISGEILYFAQNAENPLVIMGAYGRSTISNLIIPSVARRIIEYRKIPLFIAHR